MKDFNEIFGLFRQAELIVHGFVFIANILILFFSEAFLGLFNKGKDIKTQARILRAGAVVFLILHIVDILLVNTFPAYQHYFIKIGFSLATVFGCLILFNIISYLSRQKFGYQKTIDEKVVYLDSYNSRLLDLLTSVVVIFIAIYCIVNIWELKGLLQTTGLLGIVFGSLALTSSVWFPDVYFGLVILNSNMLEDGDVIKLVDNGGELVISRVSFVYTILLDVRSNHRVLIRNSRLVEQRIDNLSKRASADGLRHAMDFNVGFPMVELSRKVDGEGGAKKNPREDSEGNPNKDFKEDDGRVKGYTTYRHTIQTVFDRAFDEISENKEAKINRNLPFEVALTNTGDYALTFRLNYYLESLPNTKVTKTLRQFLVRTPSLIQEAVNASAVNEGVVLATPMLVDHKEQAGNYGSK